MIGLYVQEQFDAGDSFFATAGFRVDDHERFGAHTTFRIAPAFFINETGTKFKATYGTGFRAPSLNQLWFNSVGIQFVIDPATGELEPSRVLTANNKSTVTRAFGIPDLKEETSLNISAGLIATPLTGLIISLDYYYITIDDRVVLTSRFTDADSVVAKILEPFASLGVSEVQFFANAVNTETQGVELVASYNMKAGEGLLKFTLSGYVGSTEVTAVNSPSSILEGFEETIFNREERNRLEDAVPQQKGIFAVTYRLNRFDVTGRINYFGEIFYKPTNPDNDEVFGAKTLLDLDVGYVVVPGFRLSVGGNNILNTFPDEQQKAANRSNERFVYSRRVTQYGMNGGFYYVRVSLSL